jgi:hypothetical protein
VDSLGPGLHYDSTEWEEFCRDHDLEPRMSRRDNCWGAGAKVMAIDAPSDTSTKPHVNDDAPTLSAKLRRARCAELCLERELPLFDVERLTVLHRILRPYRRRVIKCGTIRDGWIRLRDTTSPARPGDRRERRSAALSHGLAGVTSKEKRHPKAPPR